MQLAAQFYTLRDFTKTPEGFRDALRRCREIGYVGVQLSAIGCMNGPNPEVDAKTARKWLDEYDLICCATHRSWNLFTDLQAEIAFHQELGCEYTAVPMIANEFGYGPEAYEAFVEAAHPIAEGLAAHNIRFGYHNHDHEFARNPHTGRPCIDILASPTNPWLEMEIDTFWVAEGGVCPADFLNQCAGRIKAIHVKDLEVIPGEGAVMAPVGSGNLNWDAILEACKSGGTEWLIVEQDTCRTDPYECLKSSHGFLKNALLS